MATHFPPRRPCRVEDSLLELGGQQQSVVKAAGFRQTPALKFLFRKPARMMQTALADAGSPPPGQCR